MSGASGRELFFARNAGRVVAAARPDLDVGRVAQLAGWVTDEAVASNLNPQAMHMRDIDSRLVALLDNVERRYRAVA